MPGYEPAATAGQTVCVDGWFRTGDQGYIDHEGYLFLTGRIGEVINRGGEKISPREVDEALLEHPAIAQAVAFALPHPTLGQDIAAAVVLKEGSSESANGIRAFLFERLPAFKIPSEIVIVPAIPIGPTGKLQRRGLASKLAGHLKRVDAEPRNELERVVAGIFAEVLMIDKFGIDDNFFALGGDSIRATQIVTRIASILGTELPSVALFRNPTISALVAEIAESVATMDPIRGRTERT
jgi:acyl carrier protein